MAKIQRVEQDVNPYYIGFHAGHIKADVRLVGIGKTLKAVGRGLRTLVHGVSSNVADRTK